MKKHTNQELCEMINKRMGEELLCDKLKRIAPSDRRGFELAAGKLMM